MATKKEIILRFKKLANFHIKSYMESGALGNFNAALTLTEIVTGLEVDDADILAEEQKIIIEYNLLNKQFCDKLRAANKKK
jgi:hypothetical protein